MTVNRDNNIQRTFSSLLYILLSFSALKGEGRALVLKLLGKKCNKALCQGTSHYLLGCSWSIWIFFQLRLGVTAPKGIRLQVNFKN